MSSRGRAPRGLSAQDRVLWEEIKKTIKPLRGRKTSIPAADQPRPSSLERKPSKPETIRSVKRPAPEPPPLAVLGRRARSRVARGRAEIDAHLDLHGLTLERARARLASFLASSQAHGAGLVLVITGKGAGSRRLEGEGRRGALRHEVPQWLALPEFRAYVIGFEEAAQAHGGAGALYVRVRRRRN